jgi:hypothetical protein
MPRKCSCIEGALSFKKRPVLEIHSYPWLPIRDLSHNTAGGGGGGGGYYGGGGGGGGSSFETYCIAAGGGGGGGSSYVEPSATDVHMWQGWKKSAGNGLVVLSWQ